MLLRMRYTRRQAVEIGLLQLEVVEGLLQCDERAEALDVGRGRLQELGRAVGRVAGQNGKTKYAIENATRTRIVVADRRIHILGSHANIRTAKNALCALIMGAPPGKVYNRMKGVARKMNEQNRF